MPRVILTYTRSSDLQKKLNDLILILSVLRNTRIQMARWYLIYYYIMFSNVFNYFFFLNKESSLDL